MFFMLRAGDALHCIITLISAIFYYYTISAHDVGNWNMVIIEMTEF